MILTWLIIIPGVGAVLAWLSERIHPGWPRRVALAVMSLNTLLALYLGVTSLSADPAVSHPGHWVAVLQVPWIPELGIEFFLAADGLSLVMIVLTGFLGVMAVAASWKEIHQRRGFFHFNLLWVLAGITGVFMALDLFLFYFFWEMMLVPMVFIIAIWGHDKRIPAAIKFFLFTQVSGLFMLAAILGLYFVHGRTTGTYTFNYFQLLGTVMTPSTAWWLMLGFSAAFAVKLPMVPFHTWLPDAHTQAPSAGSVILAGLLLKTGGYGFLRFVMPLFPDAASRLAPLAMALAVIAILYGSILAFAQTDLKRLIAYTSVSHMGFVLLGIFAWNQLALQGVVIQMAAHGISTGALFILAGFLQERIHTLDTTRMGGLWNSAPRMGTAAMIFVLASLGLPGMGNFTGEVLVLFGTYRVSILPAVFASLGLIGATVYALALMQRVFFGTARENHAMIDLSGRETAVMAAMAIVIVWLGMFPQTLLNMTRQPIQALGRQSIVRPADASLVSLKPVALQQRLNPLPENLDKGGSP